ncbi:MAG: hypothetical protein ABI042_07040, partial [Verrucomicrobiota bacterium]
MRRTSRLFAGRELQESQTGIERGAEKSCCDGVMLLRFCGEGFGGVERTSMETKSKSSRRYDAEFKENAVALVQSGRTIRSVSTDL